MNGSTTFDRPTRKLKAAASAAGVVGEQLTMRAALVVCVTIAGRWGRRRAPGRRGTTAKSGKAGSEVPAFLSQRLPERDRLARR